MNFGYPATYCYATGSASEATMRQVIGQFGSTKTNPNTSLYRCGSTSTNVLVVAGTYSGHRICYYKTSGGSYSSATCKTIS